MYARARRGIGYLAQENSVFRKLSTEDNIRFVLEMWPGPDGKGLTRKQQDERIDKLLEELGLTERRHSNAATLSGGERRRVEIARVLATEPKFILLDEPFTGVDPLAIADLQKVISGLRSRGIGVLITDHNVSATLAITDRSYILSEGEIKTSGPSSTLWDDPIARKYYLGEGGPIPSAQPAVPSVLTSSVHLPDSREGEEGGRNRRAIKAIGPKKRGWMTHSTRALVLSVTLEKLHTRPSSPSVLTSSVHLPDSREGEEGG
jgi:LPS export ABC transporter ATP-binding protein